jgi:hypothetical protein
MTFSKHAPLETALFVLLGALLILSTGGCERTDTTARSTVQTGRADDTEPVARGQPEVKEEVPLLLEDEPPLLLDDDPGAEAEAGPMADNSRCFVCHVNYMQEELAVRHAQANMGCATCHGPSDAHIADESWASGGNGTAPDVMYPKDKINPSCMACHPREKIDTPQHEPFFSETAGEKKVCTDCHGSHRLPQRRCKWK